MKKIFFTLIASTTLTLFTGCQTPVRDTGAFTPLNVNINNKEDYFAVVLLNQRVQNTITCPGIQEVRLPSGQLQVTANLRNRDSKRIQVQANCEFKDAQGFVVDSTPYQNVFFDDNSQESVRFVSMNDKAVRYTIRVREAK
jgi:hypothetical protein